MVEAVLYWLFLLSACGATIVLGQRNEAIFAAALVLASAATISFTTLLGWTNSQPYVLMVDAVLLLCTLILAFRSASYWPIWFAALQLIGVSSGLAAVLFPTRVPAIYIILAGFWSIPALTIMTIGIVRDHWSRKRGTYMVDTA
ncbi:MAG: hypothetical protein AABZ45_10960 [Pseudomonadota bacterium]